MKRRRADYVLATRVALGLEEKHCGNCRWLLPGGREIKMRDGTSTFCRHPDWLTAPDAGHYKRECGDRVDQEKAMMDWEPRSPRQVRTGEES